MAPMDMLLLLWSWHEETSNRLLLVSAIEPKTCRTKFRVLNFSQTMTAASAMTCSLGFEIWKKLETL